MPLANFVFIETSPSASGTAASSQPVSGGVSQGIPNGVCGLLDDYEALNVVAELQGATGGTLDVYVQYSTDEGQTWYDVIHYPQLAAAAAAIIYSAPISNTTTTAAPVVIGKNLSPALTTAPSVVNGAFTDRLRLVMKAGAGTSAGAPVKVSIVPQRARIRETGE